MSDNRGRIIEENHYYAFGLKIAGISSIKLPDANEGNINNKNFYNDKELIDEADLNWYDYGFRNYDPQIGRFPQLDPLTDDYPHYTPFQYAGNEPIANVDLDGLEESLVTGAFQGAKNAVHSVTVVGHAAKAAQAGLSGLSLASMAVSAIKIAANVVNNQIASQTLNQGLSNLTVQRQIANDAMGFYEQHKNEMSFVDYLTLVAHANNYFKGLNLMAWWAKGDFTKLNRAVINSVNLQEDVLVQIVQAGIEDSQEGVVGIMREGANVGIFISGAALFPDVGVGPKGSMLKFRTPPIIPKSRFNSIDDLLEKTTFTTTSKGARHAIIKGDGNAIFNSLTANAKPLGNRRYLLADGTNIGKHISHKNGFTLNFNRFGINYKIRVAK